MNEHPELTEADLAALERGKLPAGLDGLRATLHLQSDCAVCLARWGERLRPLLDEDWPGDPEAEDAERPGRRVIRYDFLLRRALLKIEQLRPTIEAAFVQAVLEIEGAAPLVEGRFPRGTPALQWARTTEWLAEAQASRRDAPEEYLVIAALAASYAKAIDPRDHPSGEAADLLALALAEIGNGHRRMRNFAGAEQLFYEAAEAAREGTMAQPVVLQIVRLTASLLIDQREFAEAVKLLRHTFAGYEALGMRHEAGEQAVDMGVAFRTMGRPMDAIGANLQALDRIDGRRDPALGTAVVHNLVAEYRELGQWSAAERLLPRAEQLLKRFGTPIDLLKLEWLKAQLLAGQGQYLKAARAYQDVIAGFERADLFAESAVLRLELAELYLTHQRFDRALLVLEDVREVFEAIGVRREAHAALLLAKEAVAGGCATVEVVRQVAKTMAAAEAARG
ncbi:MAG TPA: hypothetical protein VN851_24440 [Thermoanaerobaculia bacterium]|nr:hypothetical protein [Thermoanaerobaculia bacterium]